MFSSLLSQSLSKTQSPLSPAIFYAAEYLMIRLALGISSCLTLNSTSYHANWMSFRLLFCFPEVSVCSSSKFHVISLFFKVLYFSSLLFIIHQQVFPIPSLSTPIPTTVSNTYSNLLLELLLSYTAYQITSTILAKSCN